MMMSIPSVVMSCHELLDCGREKATKMSAIAIIFNANNPCFIQYFRPFPELPKDFKLEDFMVANFELNCRAYHKLMSGMMSEQPEKFRIHEFNVIQHLNPPFFLLYAERMPQLVS